MDSEREGRETQCYTRVLRVAQLGGGSVGPLDPAVHLLPNFGRTGAMLNAGISHIKAPLEPSSCTLGCQIIFCISVQDRGAK